jgi:hypothetical protein
VFCNKSFNNIKKKSRYGPWEKFANQTNANELKNIKWLLSSVEAWSLSFVEAPWIFLFIALQFIKTPSAKLVLFVAMTKRTIHSKQQTDQVINKHKTNKEKNKKIKRALGKMRESR